MRFFVGMGLSACALAAACPALAQDGTTGQSPAGTETSNDIVVTAQKREERLQDVPIAITALTAGAIQDKRILDLNDLSNQVPGLQIKSDDNAANPRIFIRGVGVNDFNPTTASAIGIYTDGIYVASPLAQRLAFFDLQQVEVLRGPQGTLYGRNTTGGAINVTSRMPGNAYEGDLSVEYGRFNSVNVQGGVSVPIVRDILAVRLAGLYQRDDGYTLNRLTGNRGNNTNRWAGRAVVAFTPSSTVTDHLVFTMGRSRGGSIWAYNRTIMPTTTAATGSDGYCTPAYYTSGQCTNILGYANTSKNLYAGDYRFEGKDKVNVATISNDLTIDLGAVSLVAVTGYQHAWRDDDEDTDASPTNVIDGRYRSRQNTFSQELRLQSRGHTRLRWVAGAYYAYDYIENNSYYDVLTDYVSPTSDNPTGVDLTNGIGTFDWPLTQRTKSYALFGQVDYDLTSQLTATVGLRYSGDDKSFHYTSEAYFGEVPIFVYDAAHNFSSVSGKVGLQYRFTPDFNIYASYNRGTKSGGFFSGQTSDITALEPYKDETVNAYEIGAKTRPLGDLLQANASVFYYDYRNLQVYTTQVTGLITRQLFTNASAARVKGAELELASQPAPDLNLTLNLSYLDATYRDFVSDGADYSGNRLPSAPRFSLQGGADWKHDLGFATLLASGNVTYRSKVYFDTSNSERLTDKARAFVDARTGLRFGPNGYELGLWVKNLFNETNISDITPVESLGFDAVSVGPPRTYGLYAKARF
ncbi:TonB-dependent receptor [Novosphingobium sp. 1949]|uniref:TonB-dependent receptor n=1 Tax=Novosphingobium organovorum TaxID=2930092 RepID=A0ABT0BGJ9_9SPHN|nr:TonB-dependent receptor [Novosphingobium organovorum]MCJ2183978.1 TonB-dependent receptor [Novosphingobium organovorum]